MTRKGDDSGHRQSTEDGGGRTIDAVEHVHQECGPAPLRQARTKKPKQLHRPNQVYNGDMQHGHLDEKYSSLIYYAKKTMLNGCNLVDNLKLISWWWCLSYLLPIARMQIQGHHPCCVKCYRSLELNLYSITSLCPRLCSFSFSPSCFSKLRVVNIHMNVFRENFVK
jgi:hypothetical protein